MLCAGVGEWMECGVGYDGWGQLKEWYCWWCDGDGVVVQVTVWCRWGGEGMEGWTRAECADFSQLKRRTKSHHALPARRAREESERERVCARAN